MTFTCTLILQYNTGLLLLCTISKGSEYFIYYRILPLVCSFRCQEKQYSTKAYQTKRSVRLEAYWMQKMLHNGL